MEGKHAGLHGFKFDRIGMPQDQYESRLTSSTSWIVGEGYWKLINLT